MSVRIPFNVRAKSALFSFLILVRAWPSVWLWHASGLCAWVLLSHIHYSSSVWIFLPPLFSSDWSLHYLKHPLIKIPWHFTYQPRKHLSPLGPFSPRSINTISVTQTLFLISPTERYSSTNTRGRGKQAGYCKLRITDSMCGWGGRVGLFVVPCISDYASAVKWQR